MCAPCPPPPQRTQDFGLHVLASKFADAGLAAFVFDYRGFGGSSGNRAPRCSVRHVLV
jgi:alpha-beta hydrolase superfamily lysophospholipase